MFSFFFSLLVSRNIPRYFGYCPRQPTFLTYLDTQVNKTVQKLRLEGNEIGDQGTIALAEALKVSFLSFSANVLRFLGYRPTYSDLFGFVFSANFPRMFLVFLVTASSVTQLIFCFF